MRIARQSVVTSKQAQELVRRACAVAGLDPRLAAMRPRHSPPSTVKEWDRLEYRRNYWRLVKARCIIAYHLRNTPLPDGSIPSYPIIAYCLRMKSHPQAMHMVNVGHVHVIRLAWPRRPKP